MLKKMSLISHVSKKLIGLFTAFIILVAVWIGFQQFQNGDYLNLALVSKENQSVVIYNTSELIATTSRVDTPGEKQEEKDKIDKGRLFYNRVPKCGSTTFDALLKNLAKLNNFSYVFSNEYMKWHIREEAQATLVKKVSGMKAPMAYNRHIHYVDFTRFGYQRPIYINIIRDPIERLRSSYYYRKSLTRNLTVHGAIDKYNDVAMQYLEARLAPKNMTYDECVLKNKQPCNRTSDFFVIIPFFCGQDDFCLKPLKESLARAKHNVKHNFALVGVTEEMDLFIQALEVLLPTFFANSHIFKAEKLHKNSAKSEKLPLTQGTVDILKSRLREEYDFYHFVQQDFHKKVTAIKRKLNSTTERH